MKSATRLTQLNERSLRRYIKRFDIKLKRGAYNSYRFSDNDIRKLVIIRTMLKENRDDSEIVKEITNIDTGAELNHEIKTEILPQNGFSNKSTEIIAVEQVVENLALTLGKGITSISESIDDIERNLSDRLEKGNNKLENITELLDVQKDELLNQRSEVNKQSLLISQQKELIEEQEKFLKMQIHQNMLLLKKMDNLETRMEETGLINRLWTSIYCFFAGEKKKYQLKV